jgi:hypothetical protein
MDNSTMDPKALQKRMISKGVQLLEQELEGRQLAVEDKVLFERVEGKHGFEWKALGPHKRVLGKMAVDGSQDLWNICTAEPFMTKKIVKRFLKANPLPSVYANLTPNLFYFNNALLNLDHFGDPTQLLYVPFTDWAALELYEHKTPQRTLKFSLSSQVEEKDWRNILVPLVERYTSEWDAPQQARFHQILGLCFLDLYGIGSSHAPLYFNFYGPGVILIQILLEHVLDLYLPEFMVRRRLVICLHDTEIDRTVHNQTVLYLTPKAVKRTDVNNWKLTLPKIKKEVYEEIEKDEAQSYRFIVKCILAYQTAAQNPC